MISTGNKGRAQPLVMVYALPFVLLAGIAPEIGGESVLTIAIRTGDLRDRRGSMSGGGTGDGLNRVPVEHPVVLRDGGFHLATSQPKPGTKAELAPNRAGLLRCDL